MANGLSNSDKIVFSKEVILEAIGKLGKGTGVRGEALTLEEFARLSNYLYDRKER